MRLVPAGCRFGVLPPRGITSPQLFEADTLGPQSGVTRRFLYGPELDMLMAEQSVTDGSGAVPSMVAWQITDHLGTVRGVAKRSGSTTSVVQRVEYDPFGRRTSLSNPAASETPTFAFAGREAESLGDLTYNRHRYYDTHSGRFINQDPIGFTAGDANLYRYVGNGPTMATDPSGLKIVLPLSEGERLHQDLAKAPFFKDIVVERSEDMVLSLPSDYKYDSQNVNEEIYLAMLRSSRVTSHNLLQSLRHEVLSRQEIVWYANNAQIGFPQGKAVFDPRHFALDPINPDNGHVVTTSDSGIAVHSLLTGGQSSLGCYQTIKLTMMAGIASASRKLKLKPDLQLKNERQPHLMDESVFISEVDSLQSDLIPGDWGFIRNPAYVSGVSGHGDAGHNFIYVGWGLESLYGTAMLISDRIGMMNQEYSTNCVLAPKVGVPNPKVFK